MVQVFADLSAMQDGILSIGGNDYNHIKNVLRMHSGDQLAVRPDTDGNEEGSGEYLFEIVSFSESTVICRLLSVREAQTELPVRVLLFQGLPKADKMDQIVQKTVELGVTDIIPVQMHRSIVKLSGDKRKKRIDRWQLIAEAAAKQSRRSILPQVHDLCLMREALAMAAAEADRIFVPYEAEAGSAGTRALLEQLRPGQRVAVFVGPEGGFEESEIELAREQGAQTISLGRWILRTETAAPAFLAFLTYRFELD